MPLPRTGSPTLIGLTGPEPGGLDIVAGRLLEHHNFARLNLADPVHDMAAAMLCLSREQWDRRLLDPLWRQQPLPHTGVSPEHLLRTLADDWGLSLGNGNIWLELLRQRLAFIQQELPYEYDGVVIADVRRNSEAAFVRRHGVLIHIARPSPQEQPLSTAGLAWQQGDQLLLHTGFADLCRQVDRLFQQTREMRAPYMRNLRESA